MDKGIMDKGITDKGIMDMLRHAELIQVLHFDCLSHFLVLPLSAAQLSKRDNK